MQHTSAQKCSEAHDIYASEAIFFLVSTWGGVKRAQRRVGTEQYMLARVRQCISGEEEATLTQMHKVLVFSCKESVVQI